MVRSGLVMGKASTLNCCNPISSVFLPLFLFSPYRISVHSEITLDVCSRQQRSSMQRQKVGPDYKCRERTQHERTPCKKKAKRTIFQPHFSYSQCIVEVDRGHIQVPVFFPSTQLYSCFLFFHLESRCIKRLGRGENESIFVRKTLS